MCSSDLKEKGKLKALKAVRVEWQGNKMVEVPGSEQVLPADLVLLAMGFVSPVGTVLDAFGVDKDPRGKTYYWIGGGPPTWKGPEGSDYLAVEAGYVSITPIHLDQTNHRAIAALEKWRSSAFSDGL